MPWARTGFQPPSSRRGDRMGVHSRTWFIRHQTITVREWALLFLCMEVRREQQTACGVRQVSPFPGVEFNDGDADRWRRAVGARPHCLGPSRCDACLSDERIRRLGLRRNERDGRENASARRHCHGREPHPGGCLRGRRLRASYRSDHHRRIFAGRYGGGSAGQRGADLRRPFHPPGRHRPARFGRSSFQGCQRHEFCRRVARPDIGARNMAVPGYDHAGIIDNPRMQARFVGAALY